MKLHHESHRADGRPGAVRVISVPSDCPIGAMFVNPTTLRVTRVSTHGDEETYTHIERLERLELDEVTDLHLEDGSCCDETIDNPKETP